MNDKWFLTAAFEGSRFTSSVDLVLDKKNMDRKELISIDVMYMELEDKLELSRRFPQHIMILHELMDEHELSQKLLAYPTAEFVSRLGHDVVNIFSPLNDYQYLSQETILERVERGTRLGQQLNFVGHLMQDDLVSSQSMELIDFIFHFNTLCRQAHIQPEIINRNDSPDEFLLPPEKLMYGSIKELVNNWVFHSKGNEKVVVDKKEKTITLSNLTDYKFSYPVPKAVLRRPFFKTGNNHGNGLGLFALSLASVTGGFSWSIHIENGSFSIVLYF